MAALTKTVDGKPLTADQFAMVGDPSDISTWHLPIDASHIDAAVDMFGHETHGTAEDRKKAARKIAAAAKEHGINADRIKNFEAAHVNCSDFNGQWVEIFKGGKYTPQGTWNGTADLSDLQRVAASYDPQHHEAPACVGHPADNLPAYGWVDRLKVADGKLLAKFREVDPAFESAVQGGRFKKRSASFYLDGQGKLAGLRHVAFLGAKPPEVKGLKNLSFDDHGQSFTSVEFGEEDSVDDDKKLTFGEWFKELISGKAPAAVAAASFSEADVKRIAAEAVTAATKPLTDQVTALQGQLDQQKAEFAEREKTGATRQRAAEAVSKLKAAGKWVPAFEAQGLNLVFDELAQSSATVEFGEAAADGKKPKVTALELLVSFMEKLPRIVPTGTLFAGGVAGGRTGKGTGDPLTDLAKARAAEKKIDFGEALAQVAEEHPELTMPGGAAAGAV